MSAFDKGDIHRLYFQFAGCSEDLLNFGQ